jgi:predicted acyl esterase
MRKFYALLIAFAALASPVRAQLGNGTLDDIKEFTTKLTVPFVMPDGVKLMTDVYLPRVRDSLRVSMGAIDVLGSTIQTDTLTFIPAGSQLLIYDSLNGQPNPNPYQLPTVFTRTPYDKGDFDELGGVMCIMGYSYMLQDMRGRYSSEGVYFPMYSDSYNKNPYHPGIGHVLDYLPPTDPKHSNKHEDGYESVKIISKLEIPGLYDGLPHTNEKVNNGDIGMIGASALGNTQLQLGVAHYVPDSLPNLKCLLPIVATSEHYTSTGYNNGTFRDRIVTGWLKGQIFSGTEDDLMPVDNDRQNSIHTSFDYDLPKTINLNGQTKVFPQNKFEAANLSIDHFTAMRYYDQHGNLANCGFYPNSLGRADMDASVAPVNQFGEAVDPVTQLPLPDLVYSRYRNLDVPVLHVTGWWDIFTEGQINTMNFTMRDVVGPNKNMQRMIIGPWAHQTVAGRKSGDRVYPSNVTELTKIDLSAFDLNNVPISDVVKSDFVTWFRYNLNYDPNNYVGEPKFIIKESTRWQRLGVHPTFGVMEVRVPSKDFIVPFTSMINFLSGAGGLEAMKMEIRVAGGSPFETTQDIPNLGPVLPSFSGDPLDEIPFRDFLNDVKPYRFYVAGPDSAADAASGYPNNYQHGNYWMNTDKFPPDENIQWKKWYLHQDTKFNTTAPTSDEGFRLYVHDPDDPILTVGGSNMIVRSPDGTRNSQSQMEMTDPTNAPFTMDREGVIQFNSDPLVDTFTIVGMPVCTLYAKTNPAGVEDGPTDTDWNIRLCDVWPDGRVYYVQEGIVNARGRGWARALVDEMGTPGAATYVNGNEDPEDKNIPYTNINIGEINEYVFKMMPIGYTFAPGHKMRILINSSNYTRYQVNPNLPLEDGEFFRRKPGDGQGYYFNGQYMEPRVAIQRVHFSPEHATSINFPVYNKDFTYTAIKDVHNMGSLEATIYPNPSNDRIQIFVNKPGDHEVVITDISGRVITNGNFDDSIIFDVNNYGQGIYFATITDKNNTAEKVTKRFIVQ